MRGAIACGGTLRCASLALDGFEFLGFEGVTIQRPAGCGVAALRMALAANGRDVDLAALEERFARNGTPVSFGEVAQVARAYGFMTQTWRVHAGQGRQLSFPAVVLMDGRHFVVVDKCDGRDCIIRDPAGGRLKASEERVFGQRGAAMTMSHVTSPGLTGVSGAAVASADQGR